MAKSEHTGTRAEIAASKVLRDDRTGKDSKTAAGSPHMVSSSITSSISRGGYQVPWEAFT